MTPRERDPLFDDLIAHNRAWVEERLREDPDYFHKLARGQAPPFLVVGCSDSRKCLNSMTGVGPGRFFVHRNIANQIRSDDTNVQSVLEFGILTLKVKHVVIAGHTRCGGVKAAMDGYDKGAVGRWLEPLVQLRKDHEEELRAIPDLKERADRLSELNVIAQAENVLQSEPYRMARDEGAAPEIHGWIFDFETGRIEEVELPEENWRTEGLLA